MGQSDLSGRYQQRIDKDPPLTTETIASANGLGNTYGGFHDNLGRLLFLNVSMEF